MSKVTFEQALAAKTVLRGQMGRPEWLRGVGVCVDDLDEGPYIKVNVQAVSDLVLAVVPDQIDGVPVRVVGVGEIVAGQS